MKKITLFFVLVCMVTLSFGQELPMAKHALARQKVSSDLNSGLNHVKGAGDIIWQTTFDWEDPSNPVGWSLPEGWIIKENTDFGNVWVWKKDTVGGNWTDITAPPSWFTSGSDGFLCLPLDEYNSRDGVTLENPSDTYIETPPIDCSAVSSVVIKFNQDFRYCCRVSEGNLEVMVTADGGVHWATYDARFATTVNNTPAARFRNVEYNISTLAAGRPNVQIRFYMHGATHYYWMIDDLRLVEANVNEVVLEDNWMDFDGGADATIGHINYWPLSQMGMPGTGSGTVGNYFFKAAFLNNGIADAENTKLDLKILKNGTQVYSDVSAGKTIWAIERDTQNIADPYLATDFGDYRMDFTAVADQPDEVPGNNTASMNFTVTDTLAHRADFSMEDSYNTGNWVGWGVAGDMVGVSYDLYAPAEINSITAYLADFIAAENPQFQFVLYKDIEGEYAEWMTSEIKDMDSSYRRTWVTLPLLKDGEAEFLQPGNYAAMVRMWGTDPDAPNGTPGVEVGVDLTTKEVNGVCFRTDTGEWIGSGMLAMVGFNIAASGGPTQAPVTFNVDMTRHIANGEFKPGTDLVDVTGLADSWNGTAAMTDPDGNGIYTATVQSLAIASVLNYKYRINGVAEAYPTTGLPYRKWTVRYWNIINNTYNGGVTTGVPSTGLVASFSVYPNPTSGAFTVNITNKVASDMIISLTNIQGQVVYQNKVSHAVNHQETISGKLSKGLYFLTVNNGAEVQVQKVVVQ